MELPLGEGVMTSNLGVPLIVLCTKSDVILSNEKGLFSDLFLEVLYKMIRTQALACMIKKSKTNSWGGNPTDVR